MQCTLHHSLLLSNVVLELTFLQNKWEQHFLPQPSCTSTCRASFLHHLCNQPQQAWGRAVLQPTGSWQCCTSPFLTGKQLKLDRDVMTCDYVSWATGGRKPFCKFSAKISLNNNIIVCLRRLADLMGLHLGPGKAKKGK